jgi:formylglycine-generating enzyme required for sulfatase activity
MLGAAIENDSKGQVADAIQSFLTAFNNLFASVPQYQTLVHQVNARAELILAYHRMDDQAGSNEFEDAIEKIIEVTGNAWSYSPTPETLARDQLHAGLPFFMGAFQSNPNGPLPSFLVDLSKREEIGWNHPGLLLAGGMIAALADRRYAGSELTELTIKTRVLFAMHSQDAPQGVIAALTVRRVPGGCGLLIPDPLCAGYLQMQQGFSSGLQNALHAARGFLLQQDWSGGQLDDDWQWSLDLLHAQYELADGLKNRFFIPLYGRSGEVAVATALIATAAHNPDLEIGMTSTHSPLDPNTAVTAKLDTESSAWNSGDFRSIPLTRVDSIRIKTMLGPLATAWLGAIVVSEDQPSESLPQNSNFEFPRASTLEQAYLAQVRFERITARVKKAIFHAVSEQLNKECDPHILPRLAREVTGGAEGQLGRNGIALRSEPVPLDAQVARRLITTGQLDLRAGQDTQQDSEQGEEGQRAPEYGNRVFVCAESGLGKSMFVLYCQQQMAATDGPLLPIRFGRTFDKAISLDQVPWDRLDAETLATRGEVNGFINAAFPETAGTKCDPEERIAWIQWMLRHGRIVFLLDALDQTASQLESLAGFLSGSSCAAIMTGRPESRMNQRKAFRDGDQSKTASPWTELRLMFFEQEDQKTYLGEDLVSRLLPKHHDFVLHHLLGGDRDLRRYYWKDLLRVPLLLSMIRYLVRQSDLHGKRWEESINSKYEIYELSMRYLFHETTDKLEDDQEKEKARDSEEEIIVQFEKIAWFMAKHGVSQNQLTSKQFKELLRELGGGDLTKTIWKLNFATKWQVFELNEWGKNDAGERLSFRHRSFLEYFAGCHIARRLDEKEIDARLEQVHRISDREAGDGERLYDWQETLRFALSAAEPAFRNQLAKRLIELGNPWIVYQAMDLDHIALEPPIADLCRILVYRNRSNQYNYASATNSMTLATNWNADLVGSLVDSAMLLDRSYRDAGYLSSLREVIGDKPFYQCYSRESSLRDSIEKLPSEGGAWNFLDSFYRIDGGVFEYQDGTEGVAGKQVQVATFQMADFPVTNALFELFCPSHRRERDQYSSQPDDPVLYVSWYMAVEFCEWLSTITGQNYGLPLDYEWEWAVRGGNKYREDSLRVLELELNNIKWLSVSSDRTRSRTEAIVGHKSIGFFHPTQQQRNHGVGLLDLFGNVWEWTSSSYMDYIERFALLNDLLKCFGNYESEGLFQLVGGSWSDDAIPTRSSRRSSGSPDYRDRFIGFRIVLR